MSELKYLVFNYSKKIGRYRTRNGITPKTVRGNAIITVPKYFIDRFNVTTFLDAAPAAVTIPKSLRQLKNNTIVERSEHKRMQRISKRGIQVSLFREMPGLQTIDGRPILERHSILFPFFFNFWMVDNAVFQIIEKARDAEKIRFSINGSGQHEALGEATDYGTVTLAKTLIKGDSPSHNAWGENCLMSVSISY